MEKRLCCFLAADAPPQSGHQALQIRVSVELRKLAKDGPLLCVSTERSWFERLAARAADKLAAEGAVLGCRRVSCADEGAQRALVARCRYCICYIPDERSLSCPPVSWALENNLGVIPLGRPAAEVSE